MTWINPPDDIVAIRDMIVACPAAVTAGLVSARFHYPASALGYSASPDTLPLVDLDSDNFQRTKYAESGVRGVASGTLMATIRTGTMTVGQLEIFARDICRELQEIATGLPNVSPSFSRCSEPTSGEEAAESDTTGAITSTIDVTITINWGLT